MSPASSLRPLLLLLIGVLAASLLFSTSARADEVAPELEGSDLRQKAQTELKKVFATLEPKDQRRLVGTYVVFDSNASDPFAQVACDDDGDYTVLLSDAMLRLLAHVARAQSIDEANGSHRNLEYASFLAQSQVRGRRLLPPPPGFFNGQRTGTSYEERLGEGLSFVIAHELARLRSGDLACPKPTATKESGDDEWTAAEQRKALDVARSVYPTHTIERDVEAIGRVVEAGHSENGAIGFLWFFAKLEAERLSAAGRFLPTYAAQHPGAASRGAALKGAVVKNGSAPTTAGVTTSL